MGGPILFSRDVISFLEHLLIHSNKISAFVSHECSACSHNYSFTKYLEFKMKQKNPVPNSPKSLVGQKYSKTAIANEFPHGPRATAFATITAKSMASAWRLVLSLFPGFKLLEIKDYICPLCIPNL